MVTRLEEVKNAKIEKYNELKKKKYDSYAIEKFDKQFSTEEIRKKYDSVKTGEVSKESVKTAGRIMIIRGHGKLFFMDLQDGTGKIQLVMRQDATKNFEDNAYLGAGDFVGLEGKVTRTNSGELSINVANFQILSKNIMPLPEKWHGLVDDEERLRKRYIDILMNPEVREIFTKKAKFWNTIRQFLLEKGFLEVETPVLETSAGGASATPFKTHHNALNIDVFLRISMGELWQKKLMVAGFEKTFEIGRQFRNEGMDIEHLQDYTQMEFYWAYADYKDGMKLVEEMYKKIAKEVFGTLKFETHGYTVDFAKEWEIYDYENTIKKHTSIEIYKADEKQIKKKLTELKIDFDPNVDKWRLVDILWKFCRKKLSGPGFLTNQPVEISPLAKRDPKNSRKVHQFQVIIAGSEIGNGYSELNDPFDQEERFKQQMELKKKGDTEAQDHDFSFVEALQYGMPPTCGFGVSERLFSFLMDKPIRECVIFPLMKPESKQNNPELKETQNEKDSKKKK